MKVVHSWRKSKLLWILRRTFCPHQCCWHAAEHQPVMTAWKIIYPTRCPQKIWTKFSRFCVHFATKSIPWTKRKISNSWFTIGGWTSFWSAKSKRTSTNWVKRKRSCCTRSKQKASLCRKLTFCWSSNSLGNLQIRGRTERLKLRKKKLDTDFWRKLTKTRNFSSYSFPIETVWVTVLRRVKLQLPILQPNSWKLSFLKVEGELQTRPKKVLFSLWL